MTHVGVLGAALLVLLCLPCAVAVIARGGQPAIRRAWLRQSQRHAVALRRLDRHLSGELRSLAPQPRPAPGIEQIAADLRRLERLRRSRVTACSQLWQADIERAYDRRLRMASSCLGVAEHLTDLEGLDLDIERLRVVTELESAGLALRQRS